MTTATPPPYVLKSEELYTKGYDPRVTARLFDFIRPYRQRLLLALAYMLISSAVAVAGPYLVKVALDAGIEAGNVQVLRNTVLVYLAAISLQWAATYLRVNIMAVVGQSIIYDLRERLFAHLQELSLNFFSHYSVGRVITRVINDVGTLREFLTWAILAIARDLFTLFGILAAMLFMNLRLSLLSFIVLPLMVLVTIYFRRKSRIFYRKVRAAVSWVNSVLAENINGVRVVQAFSRQEHNAQFFRTQPNRYLLDMTLQAARLSAVFLPAIDFLGSIATVIVVAVGGAAVLGETLTPGVLVAFILYIDRFFEPIRDLSRRFDTFQATMASGERILDLLDTHVEVQDLPGAIDLPPIRGEVWFDNVSFNYPDDPTPVLKNINLRVNAGETVALVGETGAGKTTLIKLVARFHDPVEGKVWVDGHDLCTVTQHSLRSQMGIVLQDPFLFNGTVGENIRFGRLNASQAEVEAAAQAVGAHDFILQLRHGYNTNVEEGGVLLSVGQRQLISFARALLADPRILILDEATSSVDTQTERLIQRALERLLRGRTAFVIAHRLSTVVNADRIVVIEDGEIKEQGTHEELLARQGIYDHLYQAGLED
jgi:ATP-binding cassette subfamily B protein/subfamily B ATP-binding cassette protein MsbA